MNLPYFCKIDKFPYFRSIYVSLLTSTLRFLLSPYFDHDAFMHHALHVLNAPGNSYSEALKA